MLTAFSRIARGKNRLPIAAPSNRAPSWRFLAQHPSKTEKSLLPAMPSRKRFAALISKDLLVEIEADAIVS